jgi:D-glycero-D-manno-heptose 1,7-bisphosphate phosphatase
LISVAAIERTNAALVELLEGYALSIAAVKTCMHHPEGGPGGDRSLIEPCSCRKPQPGMLVSLAEELDLDRAATWMLGDTAADLGAARAAGMRCGLVLPVARCELCTLHGVDRLLPKPDVIEPRFDRLAEAVIHASTPSAG